MRDAGYTRRPRQLPKEDEQEPVAWMQESTGCIRSDWGFDKTGYVLPYTTPPQRQPLTDGEVYALVDATLEHGRCALARAIERAHGIE
jgi:hypothetical protein